MGSIEEEMKVNLSYIYDILGSMIEAQYWDEVVIEDYMGFVEDYQERIDSQRSDAGIENFHDGLRIALKAILNRTDVDQEEIFFKGAKHGLDSQEQAKNLFEMIWNSFFPNENWHDDEFLINEVVFVNETFFG
ncbi:MAG: hypothetical protein AAF821_12720 [Cyanobacteria bacterium P01_D01_bin.156]